MKNILFIIFALSTLTSVSAQIVITDQKDTETLEISEGDKATKSNKRVTKNNWKVDVLGVVFGKYGVTYERELFDFLSIESSVGMTYINFSEFYLSFFSFDKSVDITANKDVPIKELRSTNILNAKPGYFFNVRPKFYLEGFGFEGMYLSPGFNYSKYNYKKIEDRPNYNAINNTQIGGEFGLGYQWINGKSVVDFSTSFGLNSNNANMLYKDQEYNIQYLSFYYGISLKLGRYF